MKKTAVITGSSRGIGAATALKFAELGYNVVINYHNSSEKAINLMNDIRKKGGTAIALKADVSNYDEALYLIKKSAEEFGKIDVLVNNAGIGEQKLFTDITPYEWDKMLKINTYSVFNCCSAAVPRMVTAKSGKIVNVSSMWGIVGASCEVHYSASKAAVIGFTKAIAKELGPSGIQVNCVAPGVIDTDMNSNLTKQDKLNLIDQTPVMRLGTANEIASCIAFLCSDDAKFIAGQVISPNGGFLIY